MSRREDILSCIDVTIMDRTANTALPSHYSKTPSALGAAIHHLRVECSGTFSFARPLRAREGGLEVAIETLRIDRRRIEITERRKALQSEIHSQARDRVIQDRFHARSNSARCTFEEGPEIKSGLKPPLALVDFDRQFVAIIKDRVDLAPQAREPLGMLVFFPQAQDPSSGRSRAGHPYSIARNPPKHWKTPRNEGRAMRVARFLLGLKAGDSRGDLG